VHPSFPAGHATQNHLIACCLKEANRPANQPEMLDKLARRIAQNRVIAGLHYPLDNDAGEAAANACFELLKEGAKFNELLEEARKEGKQLSQVPAVQEL